MTRAEKAAHAAALRAGGCSLAEVAESMGISTSYASELLNDPTGSKSRARKQRYRGTCETCGGRTTGGNGPGKAPATCAECAKRELIARTAVRRTEEARPRRQLIQRMWLAGESMEAIIEAVGVKDRSQLGKLISDMRRAGWEMPYRRVPKHFTGARAA